ncbi:MAG: hypothetical protein WDA27_08880 [Actinomycetota bacterium]
MRLRSLAFLAAILAMTVSLTGTARATESPVTEAHIETATYPQPYSA